MVRPDQAKFYLLSRQFELIDDRVYRFAVAHQLGLQKNLQRQPCRVLRLRGDPDRFIRIALDGHWFSMERRDDPPHSVAATAYHRLATGETLVKEAALLQSQPFAAIAANLEPLLEEGLRLLQSWPAPVISQDDPL